MRPYMLCVLAAAFFGPAALLAQPPRPTPPFQAYFLLLLSNEAAHKDLGLDEPQKKKAIELSRAASSRAMSVITGRMKGDVLAKEIEKDLAFLKPAQRKRLRELTWQRLASIPAGPPVIAGDAAASAELKLTKQQKEKLASREALALVLTDEQKKALKAIQGKPAAAEVFQPFPRPGRAAPVPTVLQYLQDSTVAAELKPTEKQKETFAALAKKWRDKVPSRFVSSAEQAKEAAGLARDIEKDARATLAPAQAKRLAEIVLQVQKRGLRGDRDLFTLPAVAKALKLSEDQKKKLAETLEQRQKGLLQVFTTGGEARDVMASAARYNDETYKNLLAELTAEQKKALDGLLGKPFAGEFQPVAFLPMDRSMFARPQGPRHLFLVVRPYLGTVELHKELGLTEDQKKKVAALATDRPSPRETDEKKLAALAAATEKELAAVLKPEQIKRLGQVMLQQYGRFPFGLSNLPHLLEVRKGLGLTKEQLEKLTRRDFGPGRPFVRLEDALTDAQKAKWKEMLGKPTEVRLGPGGSPGQPALPQGLALLRADGAAADLKLSDAQKEKLSGLAKEYEAAASAARQGDFTEFRKKMREAQEAATAGVAKLLDAAQKKRLAELNLQQARQAGLERLLSAKAVVEGLKLTREQSAAVAAAYNGGRQVRAALNREFGVFFTRDVPEGVRKAQEAIAANADKKMMEALSKEQREALKKMLGGPFKGTLPRDRFGGFGGGFGGGPGGPGGFGGPIPPG